MRNPHPPKSDTNTGVSSSASLTKTMVSFSCINAEGSNVETLQSRIERISRDAEEVALFYNMELSPRRYARLHLFLSTELTDLQSTSFQSYSQNDKVDYLLL